MNQRTHYLPSSEQWIPETTVLIFDKLWAMCTRDQWLYRYLTSNEQCIPESQEYRYLTRSEHCIPETKDYTNNDQRIPDTKLKTTNIWQAVSSVCQRSKTVQLSDKQWAVYTRDQRLYRYLTNNEQCIPETKNYIDIWQAVTMHTWNQTPYRYPTSIEQCIPDTEHSIDMWQAVRNIYQR